MGRPVAVAEKASQPSAACDAAVFDEVLRIEMGARIVLGSSCMDDRQMAVVPQSLERTQPRIQSEESVEPDDVLPANADTWTAAVVTRVLDGRHKREAIGGAAEDPLLRAGARIQLAYRLEINDYRGSERLQLNCQHLRLI